MYCNNDQKDIPAPLSRYHDQGTMMCMSLLGFLALPFICLSLAEPTCSNPLPRAPDFPSTSPEIWNPTNFPVQLYTTMTQPISSYVSSERIFYDHVKKYQVSKWGWVFYRTCYDEGTDEKWDKLKNSIQNELQYSIAKSDTPELLTSLDWKFLEDKEALEGATVEQLRQIFKTWVTETKSIENPYNIHMPGSVNMARYSFFIRVDQKAMDSMIDSRTFIVSTQEFISATHAVVDLVEISWKPLPLSSDEDEFEEDDEPEYEALEGCTEYDVGWMRIGLGTLVNVEWYHMLSKNRDVQIHYQRPPMQVKY